jgi:predicted metal-dependent HD superfamily phosphohydrolase
MLLITALFHDIIYNPYRNDNEERSAELLLHLADKSNLGDINQIVACILDTKRHIPSSPLSAIFSEMDMNIIKQPFTKLLEWEAGIAYEYSYLPRETYLIRRIIFLQDMVRRYPENAGALSELIEYLEKNK